MCPNGKFSPLLVLFLPFLSSGLPCAFFLLLPSCFLVLFLSYPRFHLCSLSYILVCLVSSPLCDLHVFVSLFCVLLLVFFLSSCLLVPPFLLLFLFSLIFLSRCLPNLSSLCLRVFFVCVFVLPSTQPSVPNFLPAVCRVGKK